MYVLDQEAEVTDSRESQRLRGGERMTAGRTVSAEDATLVRNVSRVIDAVVAVLHALQREGEEAAKQRVVDALQLAIPGAL